MSETRRRVTVTKWLLMLFGSAWLLCTYYLVIYLPRLMFIMKMAQAGNGTAASERTFVPYLFLLDGLMLLPIALSALAWSCSILTLPVATKGQRLPAALICSLVGCAYAVATLTWPLRIAIPVLHGRTGMLIYNTRHLFLFNDFLGLYAIALLSIAVLRLVGDEVVGFESLVLLLLGLALLSSPGTSLLPFHVHGRSYIARVAFVSLPFLFANAYFFPMVYRRKPSGIVLITLVGFWFLCMLAVQWYVGRVLG